MRSLAHRNFFRDLRYLRASWTFVAGGDSKLRHQPSIRSGTRLSTSQAPQAIWPWQRSAAQTWHVFSEKIVIVTDYDVLDSAPGTEQLFAEQLALFLLLRCEFHGVYYSPGSFQKLCHSTRRAYSHAKANVVASTATVHTLQKLTTSHVRTTGGAAADNKPVRDRSNRRRTRRVSFFPVFWRLFSPFGVAQGGGGGLPFKLVWRLVVNFSVANYRYFFKSPMASWRPVTDCRLDDMAFKQSMKVRPGYQYRNEKTTWI